jgi:hypothetical protein
MTRICFINDTECTGDRRVRARGLCVAHYQRWYRGALVLPGHVIRTEAETEEPWLCECAHPDMDNFTPGMCRRCSRPHRDHLSPTNRRALEAKERAALPTATAGDGVHDLMDALEASLAAAKEARARHRKAVANT